MSTIDNLLDTLHRAHCDNAQQAYYARQHRGRQISTMPVTSFVYEFFLFNSLYQYDWHGSFKERRLVPWPADKKELPQQVKLEDFVRERCKADPSIIRRAFDPIAQLEDLDGHWTHITPDARITLEQGKSFFNKLSRLRDLMRSDNDLTASKAVFELIKGCREFIYFVRNNIFHGSKSIGEIYEPNQRRRLEVYDIFLKSLVSLFFLAVNRTPVAADYVQLPVRITFQNGDSLSVGQSEIADLVVLGWMKPEDSRLIQVFRRNQTAPVPQPDSRTALFYPSAGMDMVTPLLLGLPYCAQFFFYDIAQSRSREQYKRKLQSLLNVPVEMSDCDGDEIIRFNFAGVSRIIHLVHKDNLEFFDRDVDLAFYFHRGDSLGEGGSGQEWDKLHIVDLGEKTPNGCLCQILTDGEPCGLHANLRSRMQAVSIPVSCRGRDYYFGFASGDFLREMEKTEPEPEAYTDKSRRSG